MNITLFKQNNRYHEQFSRQGMVLSHREKTRGGYTMIYTIRKWH
jgi:hypothetical protein